MKTKARSTSRGFTLIELLVVIAILALLSTGILASLADAREDARIAGGLQFSSSLYRTQGADLLALWTFDEGSMVSIPEMSGQHNGTLAGTPLPTWSTDTPSGKGHALQIANGGSMTGAGTVSTPSPNITISAWIKTTVATPQTIISVRGGGFIFFGTTSGKLYAYINNSSTPSMISNEAINDGRWHHVVWTGNGTQSIMYIDGNVDSKVVRTNTAVPAVTPYVAKDVEYSVQFTGLIDEPAIYAKTLIASEVQEIYAEGLRNLSLR